MTLSASRRAGYALVMAAMLAAALSTGTRLYYLIFYALLSMLLLGFASVVWTLATLKVELRGGKPRVSRGERISAVFSVCFITHTISRYAKCSRLYRFFTGAGMIFSFT